MKHAPMFHVESTFVIPLSRQIVTDDEVAQHRKRVAEARERLRAHALSMSGTGRAFEVCGKLD